MVDFLINFQESAKTGLPVYGLSGGKGYVWIARFDETGKGKLRFFAADPSQMTQIAQQPDYEAHIPPQSAPPVSNDEELKRKEEELRKAEAETKKAEMDAENARVEAQNADAERQRMEAAKKAEEARVKESGSRLPACPTDTSVHWDNCYGTYVWPNGEKYVGEWRDDNINVQGTYTWPDGQKYVGEFRDGKRNGKGILTPPDAEKYVGEYVGEFKDGKKDGQGSLTWPNGEKYVGEFKDDRRNGQGILTWPDGEKYIGEFRDDRRYGHGTSTRPDGETYVGEFKDDRRNGQGILTRPDGVKYVGEFKDDKFAGQESAVAPGENASERNGQATPDKETPQDHLPIWTLLLIPLFLVVIPGLWILVDFTKTKHSAPVSKVISDVNRETYYGFSNATEAKMEGDDAKTKADDSTPKAEDGWYYASEGEKHGPMRPNAITWFERLMFLGLLIGVVNLRARWEQVEAQAPFGFILTIGLVTLGAMISLILLISRKRNNVAKWILVTLFALGLPMEFNYLKSAPEFIPMVQFVIQAVAIGLLFTPTARVWLNAKRIEQVSSAPIQPHLTANRSVDIRSEIKSDADESTRKPEDGWYYAAEGEKHGPIEPEKLKSLLASGVIGRDTIVWRHGMSDWIPASQTEIWASVPEEESPPPLPPTYVSHNPKTAKEGWGNYPPPFLWCRF
jgi:hypothetical protein